MSATWLLLLAVSLLSNALLRAEGAVQRHEDKISDLVILSERFKDDTYLVTLNGGWPAFRLSVFELVGAGVEDPDVRNGLAVGTLIRLSPAQLAKMLTIQTLPEGSRPLPTEETREVSQSHVSELRTLPQRRAKAVSEEVATDVDYSIRVDATYDAPQLLTFTYSGYPALRLNDIPTWHLSVLQGTAPLASVTIALKDPFGQFKNITKVLSTPKNFVPSTTITNFTISTIIADPWINGPYTYGALIMTTQPCPAGIVATYVNNYVQYGYPVNIYLNGPSYVTIPLLSSGSAFLYGTGTAPTIVAAELVNFALENATIASGAPLVFSYQIRQGTYPLTAVAVTLYGPQVSGTPSLPLTTRTFPISNPSTIPGTILSGVLSFSSVGLLNGTYNTAGGPMVTLISPGPTFTVTNSYSASTSSCNSYASPSGVTADLYCGSFSLQSNNYQIHINGAQPAYVGPALVQLNYTGPAVPNANDTLSWSYEIALGSGPVVQMVIQLEGCPSSCCVFQYTFNLDPTMQTLDSTFRGTASIPVANVSGSGCSPLPHGVISYSNVILVAKPTPALSTILSFTVTFMSSGYSYTSPYGITLASTSNAIFTPSNLFSFPGLPAGTPAVVCHYTPPLQTDAPPDVPGAGPCEQPNVPWPNITAMEDTAAWTGGLGLLMTDEVQVWVCLPGQNIPQLCGGNSTLPPSNVTAADNTAGGTYRPLACYVYNEASKLFVYWGRNADLKLVPQPPPPPAIPTSTRPMTTSV